MGREFWGKRSVPNCFVSRVSAQPASAFRPCLGVKSWQTFDTGSRSNGGFDIVIMACFRFPPLHTEYVPHFCWTQGLCSYAPLGPQPPPCVQQGHLWVKTSFAQRGSGGLIEVNSIGAQLPYLALCSKWHSDSLG